MAKLNVVIPSVDVEVNGVKYRKVERSAVAGDIIKITDEDVPSYVTDGGFYTVDSVDYVNDPQITDDDGDEYDTSDISYEVYEKVTEPIAAPSVPIKYREVKRKANVGERIKIVAAEGTFDMYSNGDIFVVDANGGCGVECRVVATDSDGQNPDGFIDDEEYVVLEPITEPSIPTQPERLKVGEYAKVTNPDSYRESRLGHIVEILVDAYDRQPFKARSITDGGENWYHEYEIIRATDAEVASAKQAASREAERTKAIGEFAEGGYAIVVNANDDNSTRNSINGNYVTTEVSIGGRCALKLTNPDGKLGGYCNADALRKITKEEYEAATKPKVERIKVGEYARTLVGRNDGKDVAFGALVKITKDDGSGVPYRAELLDGSEYDWYRVGQLEKVSAEEIAKIAEEAKWNAIGRKVGEYKAGDVVVVTSRGSSNYSVGLVDYVTDDRGITGSSLRLSTGVDGKRPYINPRSVKLIAPVESLFNVTTAGGERK